MNALVVIILCSSPVHGYYNETLIKNITNLLDTLLDNYDQKLRPGHGEHPINITVSISIRSFGTISEKNMDYSVDCYFRQKWKDERLKFQGSGSLTKLSLAPKVLQSIWRPDTYIKNGLRSYLHKLTVPNILLRVSENGEVYVSQRLTLHARCHMNLVKFPMDSQACPLIIGSLGYSTDDVKYRWAGINESLQLDMEDVKELAQYQISQRVCTQNDEDDIRGNNYAARSTLYGYIILRRQQGYYILQIYLPCTLIVVMSWVSFWINKEASPARVSLGIMTVLNMSTVGMGNRNDLPKVSYATALDVYFFACFGFVFLALVEYAVINFANIVYLRHTMQQLRGMQNAECVQRMRMFAGQMMGAPSEQLQGVELEALTDHDKRRKSAVQIEGPIEPKESLWQRMLHIFRPKRRESMFVRMAKKAARTREKLEGKDPSKSVDKIDQIAKVIFPLTYVVFNAFYWVIYLFWLPDEIDSYEELVGLVGSSLTTC